MNLQSNPELELAYEYVYYTNKSVFLTGRAGTGKTTFLHGIRNESAKRMAVVAPTGVAAINAGGMTIHSLFQLPFGPYLPGNAREASRQRRFSREKIRLIRSLDLLVIDEISMVRADLLDGIDDVLRRYKNSLLPFGGVQLLMIGDLHQLPPVVKEEEWYLLREHYRTPYFFGSIALQEIRPVVVELKHIYRQSDETFIHLLNKVRNNAIDADVLEILNSRFDPNFQAREEDAYITLTTHNRSADKINARKLDEISSKVHTFSAEITGNFPAYAYPTHEELELKPGAQVMFVKNDLEAEKRYYNGKIGKIVRIVEDEIYVLCPGDRDEITVTPSEWKNVKYALNEQSKEVEEEVVGVFTQYPLRLAWAITIHKSQGLTFERVILDAKAAFAHGQVYVALSRCKSFEGIVLHSKIDYSSVRTDTVVKNFTEAAEKNAPDKTKLKRAKAEFQRSQILALFDFKTLRKGFEAMNRILLEHENSLHADADQQFRTLVGIAKEQVFPIEEKFGRQLCSLFTKDGLPEKNETLQKRIRKASAWFVEKIKNELQPAAQNIKIVSDNKKVRKIAKEALTKLQKEIFVKQTCLLEVQDGFSTQAYLRAKANADLDFKAAKSKAATSFENTGAIANTPHPKLYAQLLAWRRGVAQTQEMQLYGVLPTRSLIEIVQQLPVDKAGLQKIHGIGKGRIKRYGADLLVLIQTYCAEHQVQTIPTSLEEEKPGVKKPPKPNTKAVSFELYQTGKSIEEIAAERKLQPTTIEGHLTHYIASGQLSVFDFLKLEDVEKIAAFVAANPSTPLSEAKGYFEDAYSYGQIKMVVEHLKKG